jgi:hypothetical protein
MYYEVYKTQAFESLMSGVNEPVDAGFVSTQLLRDFCDGPRPTAKRLLHPLKSLVKRGVISRSETMRANLSGERLARGDFF